MNFYNNFFEEEFKSQSTQYFIFDTGKQGHRDKDFEYYSWRSSRYNLVNEGDLFIYRKPAKVSENGKFYFFGACKIGKINITNISTGDQRAYFDKKLVFESFVYPDELENLVWKSKKKKEGSWEYFFNNYGMNRINREEFKYILKVSRGNVLYGDDQTEIDKQVELQKKILIKDYRVEDQISYGKSRGAFQQVFSNNIKLIYNNVCCVTGIKNKKVLVASHIIPWSENKDTRLDPKNGLCLSALIDKCFDTGLVSISNDYRLIVSEDAKKGLFLMQYLKQYEGKKIKLPLKKEYNR